MATRESAFRRVPYAPPEEALAMLACPACHAALQRQDAAMVCGECRTSYPFAFGVLDVRREDADRTAGLDIGKDRDVARALHDRAPGRSYLELYDVYCQVAGASDAAASAQRRRAESLYRRVLAETHLASGAAILEKVAWHLEGRGISWAPRGVALEDGAGLGQFIEGFARQFRAVLVLDLSLSYLVLARALIEEQGIRHALLICGNVERLPIADATVDFIHFDNMIEHVLNPEAALREARRVLRPAGWLCVISPNRFSVHVEPHFRVPAFGFFPPALQRWLAWRCGGITHIDDVRLHSLGQLRRLARATLGEDAPIAFLPRRLPHTVRQGLLRRGVVWCLRQPVLGSLLHAVFNVILLGLMPYHVLLWMKSATTASVVHESVPSKHASCVVSPAV